MRRIQHLNLSKVLKEEVRGAEDKRVSFQKIYQKKHQDKKQEGNKGKFFKLNPLNLKFKKQKVNK